MKTKSLFALISAALPLIACSTLNLDGTAESIDESFRRHDCYKQYRELCPPLEAPDAL